MNFLLGLILFSLYKSVFFINYLSFLHFKIKVLKIKFIMTDNLFEIDSAMNMIKEDIIRDLSESVSKQNKASYLKDTSSNNLSFSEKRMD